jgi:hypothetical protein
MGHSYVNTDHKTGEGTEFEEDSFASDFLARRYFSSLFQKSGLD